MGYQEVWRQYREEVQERFPLVMGRLGQIGEEETVQQPYRAYFAQAAALLLRLAELEEEISSGEWEKKSLEELRQENKLLYQEVLPEHYATSYGNPEYAGRELGEAFGKLLSMLYADLRSLIPYAFEGRVYDLTIFSELLVEVYNAFEGEELPEVQKIQQILYWFYHDYGEVFTEIGVMAQTNPEMDFYTRIIMDSDLEDLRYLYRYGAYITENEIGTAEFLNRMGQEEIQAMADTYTEGYRIGFEVTGKDLSKKKFVDLRYPIGFERMMRAAVKNFEKMGLQPVVTRTGELSFSGRNGSGSVSSTSPNRQYGYDHKSDRAAYLDKALVERRLEVLKTAYEARKKEAAWYAGPAVVETFGEEGFAPKANPYAWQFDEKQQKLNVYYSNMATQITNQYIKGEERSFTIIAYPIPEIGADYQAIFAETVKVNTLDYKLYQEMQQKIIDVLDSGESVRITGRGKNTTDLTVALYPLTDRTRETSFENLGEFAIGTNTTAYRMGVQYQIQDKLPILIAEKTGPHFAVGDTCYSWSEDTPVFNPDGKEIMARDNEVSALRKEDPQKAYFNCHTDITVPYDELGQITVQKEDGACVDIIRDGKFVVPGTELLNKPLE